MRGREGLIRRERERGLEERDGGSLLPTDDVAWTEPAGGGGERGGGWREIEREKKRDWGLTVDAAGAEAEPRRGAALIVPRHRNPAEPTEPRREPGHVSPEHRGVGGRPEPEAVVAERHRVRRRPADEAGASSCRAGRAVPVERGVEVRKARRMRRGRRRLYRGGHRGWVVSASTGPVVAVVCPC